MTIGLLSRSPLSASIHRRVMAFPNSSPSIYDSWSRKDLIAKLTELDIASAGPKQRLPSPKRLNKAFHFASHSRRKIALKFCYSGWEYNGLAFQNMKTALPTVEQVLFDALVKSRLIDPEAGFDGCGWEKCGRTDRGVSAAGQVISLWVRSALETDDPGEGSSASVDASGPIASAATLEGDPTLSKTPSPVIEGGDAIPGLEFGFDEDILDSPPTNSSLSTTKPKAKVKYEHDYLAILNRLLPATIRILAWSPVSEKFSARFSCTYRHYKYFFSSETAPGPLLDIGRMRTAASLLVGEHDFRNLCKLDAGKQITMFKRNVMKADIEALKVDTDGKGIYVFNLIGSAFLYHQVRHIMSVLFMVGFGQEEPSVITDLMNIAEGLEHDAAEVVDSKPEYQMADALPLILWDCGYPKDELDWQTTNGAPVADGTEPRANLYQQLHGIHSRSQVYTTLNDHFLAAASRYHPPPSPQDAWIASTKLLIPLGGGTYKRTAQEKYTPLLRRNRLDHVEVVNERWRLGKGFRRNERRKATEAASEDDGNE